jgi:hypothetical protein
MKMNLYIYFLWFNFGDEIVNIFGATASVSRQPPSAKRQQHKKKGSILILMRDSC